MIGRVTLVVGFAALAVLVAPAARVGGRLALSGPDKASGSGNRLISRTLVSLRKPIWAFAQDGGRIAWAWPNSRCGSVTVRTLANGRDYTFDHALACGVALPFTRLALARAQALWTSTWAGNDVYVDVSYGVVGRRAYLLDETSPTDCNGGDQGTNIPAIAGDGPTLLYADVDIEPQPPDDQVICDDKVSKSGGVFRASGAQLPHVPPAVALAVSGTRIAVAPLDPSTRSGGFRPAADGPVQVYTTRGRLVSIFSPPGTVLALALSPEIDVALMRTRSGKRIEWHKASNGALLGFRHVARITAPSLSVAGTTIVYRVGLGIWKLDARTGKASALTSADSQPIGLSIEGRRVAWAENIRGRGRVQALELPSRGA